jgi:DNA-binding response OmpR family regulator
MRILLIEDSPRFQRAISTALKHSGYSTDCVDDGEEGLWMAAATPYDVIILDLMLPKLDGLTLLQRLRKEGNKTHVLILTARDSIEDRVLGLKTGADDYLVKPFAIDELVARVQALCRRSYSEKTPVLQIADLVIDTAFHKVSRNTRQLDLTSREYALLEYLAFRCGQVVSRAEIENHVMDNASDPVSNVIDAGICTLRRKLCLNGEPQLIHTRRGTGYVLEKPNP